MTLQDLGEAKKAVDAYGYAVVLDPYHWSSLANLGSVLHDDLRLHDEALEAYNKAYTILTQKEVEPTDAPAEPRFILSQLQYRIGLCLYHDLDRKCALDGDPETPVSCKEMATHAFSLAVQFDPENESAKHMLATITADATLKRASNTYVKNLFDDYAEK
jgi:tetratricopeptide (TPR) repeat protein